MTSSSARPIPKLVDCAPLEQSRRSVSDSHIGPTAGSMLASVAEVFAVYPMKSRNAAEQEATQD